MIIRNWISILALIVSSCSAAALGSDPYGSKAVNYLDVSPDGRYLGGVRQDGQAFVIDLANRERVTSLSRGKMPGVSGGPHVDFLVFRGSLGEVLWDCRRGSVCSTDLASGEKTYLFEHDPQDNVMVGAVSRNGLRMAFGTRGGRVFTYDPSIGEQRTLKPRDIWSRVVAPMYSLEAPPELGYTLTASAGIGAAASYEKHERTKHHPEGYIDVPNAGMPGTWFRDVLYRGINIWDWETGKRHMIDDGFTDKIRADWSRDGRLVAINQEGGSPYAVYEVDGSGVRMVTNLFKAGSQGCDGLRFLDPAGRYLGVVSYESKIMTVIDRETVDESQYNQAVELRLRTKPAGGRRMMVAYPEKGWVFLGLRDGGIDWYEFKTEPELSLEHVNTLR